MNGVLAILVFAAEAATEGGAHEGFMGEWLPTVARWFNVLLFGGVLFFLLRGPVRNALRARRENIRRDLMRAQEERDAALAKLAEVQGRLANLDSEVAAINAQSQREAAAERERLARETEEETRKIREQARREIDSAAKIARHDLRRYAAEQSVRLAEEIIRRDIRPEDDARLVRGFVDDLRGMKG